MLLLICLMNGYGLGHPLISKYIGRISFVLNIVYSLTFLKIRGSSTSGAVIKTLCVRVPSSNDFISHSVSRKNFESTKNTQNDWIDNE